MDDRRDLFATAEIGREMEGILRSDAWQTGLTLVRARIFDEWVNAPSPEMREQKHADIRALERLQEAFRDLDQEGAAAREAIRAMREAEAAEADTDL
jgi:hypothetical protein